MKSVAVFCGSKPGLNPLYMQHATELGLLLAQNNITLIYGGGKVGLMGAVANAVMDHSGKVIGVIPELLVEWEQQHKGISDLKIVADMHVRKKMMYELCDAAIILPGGNGTLDEMFEMITWNTLKIHEKQLYILNTGGYYNNLLQHIEIMRQEGFLYEDLKERVFICNTPQAILSLINENRNSPQHG